MTSFPSFAGLRAACLDLPAGDDAAAAAAAARDAALTKPPGSLGRLEELVVWLARWQARNPPQLDRIEVLVFAGNHGVVAQGVSAFPAAVTVQMVANFAAGGAAINQLAGVAGAKPARHPARARPADGGLHRGARHGRGRVSRRRRDRLRRRAGRCGPRLSRRNGHRQHHGGGRDRGRAVRRRRRALGGPRHRGRRSGGLARKRAAIDAALARHGASSAIRCRSRPHWAGASSPPSWARRSRRGDSAFRW